MITNSHLKFPPIKCPLAEFPKRAIYGVKCYISNTPCYHFSMFSLEPNNKAITKMLCRAEKISRDGEMNVPSLNILLLRAIPQDQGWGTAMIDFAKNFSRKIGCEGRLHLIPNAIYNPLRSPHLFYRKCGFATKDKAVNKKIDRFIKKRKDANWRDLPQELWMYYPPQKLPQKETLISKLFSRFLTNKKG